MTGAPDFMLRAPDRGRVAVGRVLRCLARDSTGRRSFPRGGVHCALVHQRQDFRGPLQALPGLAASRHCVAFRRSGQMQLRVDGGDAIDVRAGELVLLPHNDAHSFGSDLNAAPISAHEVIQPPQSAASRESSTAAAARRRKCCAASSAPRLLSSPLLSALPPVLKLDVRATASGAWIESSFRFAVSEIAAGRMGSATVIAKLSELLFVEAVSQYVASLPEERRGWLAGLRDPQIGRALALLHARPAEDWTAEALASRSGHVAFGICRAIHVVGRTTADAVPDALADARGGTTLARRTRQCGASRLCSGLRVRGCVQPRIQAPVRQITGQLAQAAREIDVGYLLHTGEAEPWSRQRAE